MPFFTNFINQNSENSARFMVNHPIAALIMIVAAAIITIVVIRYDYKKNWK